MKICNIYRGSNHTLESRVDTSRWKQYTWNETPLETTIEQVSLPVEELNYPAVTVCNPSELQMPRRNRWMYLEKLLNWIDVDQG